ncbi:CYFA0S12e03862g1_1 [Cyberlindnera fabianii]|uniref:CYFA0S12e03862g1_1 n=1 Tax=Cyberlindnera fabianii TaxID=36022 RepID=A0A061B1P9_CYBFA|nr:Riboflavin transporter MCH5 [Cyberlindnera fabianii]CDR43745.1 CYFA0S12e03862g1_1 [Cyberlindnera fabianii]
MTSPPLETSKTVVPGSSDYFSHTGSSSSDQTAQMDQITSQKKNSFSERDIELNPVPTVDSNRTIGNNAENDKDDMLGEDADLYFPEGGLKAYTVVFGSFMGLVSTFGLLNSQGVIETYVAENQLSDVKSSTVAWIFSIYLFLTFLTSIFSGTYFDRNGVKVPVAVGGIMSFIGMFAMGNCSKVWHFVLSFSIMAGIGNGITTSPLIGVVAHYFNKRRGLMSSFASTGGSIGGIIFPIMTRKLFESVGYTWTMRIFAFIILSCYCVSFLLVQERLPHKTTQGNKWDKFLSYFTAFDIKGLKSKDFLFVCLGTSFAESAVLILATYQASFARAHGFSMSTSYLLISISHVGGIFGRWITGFLSDKIGRFNIMYFTLILAAVIAIITLVPFGDHLEALYVFTVGWGFFTGSVFSLLPVCCAQISKTEDFGRRYGTMYFITAFGVLVCIPISGAIIGDGSVDDYRNMVIHAAVTIFASGVFYFIARLTRVGWNFTAKF